jgi:hypothetical protein
LPVIDLFEPGHAPQPDGLTQTREYAGTKRRAYILQAQHARDFIVAGDKVRLTSLSSEFAGQLVLLRTMMLDCRMSPPPGLLPGPLFDLARLTNGFLPSSQAQPLWAKLENSPCSGRYDDETRRWLKLHAAVAARQPAAMAQAAEQVLAAEDASPADMKSYAVAALMAGRTLSGQPAAAASAFQRHRGVLRGTPEWQPVFTLLSAHALGPISAERLALR